MARKKKKASPEPSPRATGGDAPEPSPRAAGGGQGGGSPASPPQPARHLRDLRPWIYAGFDFLIAAVWAYLQLAVMPNRHGWASAVMWSLAILPAVVGAAMFVRNRWGWRVAAGACTTLLVLWVILLVIILAAAAYLSGVYGSFGKAAAMGSLTMALISFQIIAMVPALQLKFLLTRAGRRQFKLEPLWH